MQGRGKTVYVQAGLRGRRGRSLEGDEEEGEGEEGDQLGG